MNEGFKSHLEYVTEAKEVHAYSLVEKKKKTVKR
jgi:hypothetical protein